MSRQGSAIMYDSRGRFQWRYGMGPSHTNCPTIVEQKLEKYEMAED